MVRLRGWGLVLLLWGVGLASGLGLGLLGLPAVASAAPEATTPAPSVPVPAAPPSSAPPSSAQTVEVDLLTVGPGDAFLTRAGHVAVIVTEHLPDGRVQTTGYNFGDTDFGDPWIPLRFPFGTLRFFVSITGDLPDTVAFYGPMQDRTVYRQSLALTPTQARTLADRLAYLVHPDRREYDYHYLEQTCSTKIRDLLDEITDGAITAQLVGVPDPWTVRDLQQLTFDGTPVVGLVGDLLFGRRHDQPIDKYYAMLWPERMRSYLPEVMVPDPRGGDALVPLAGPPQVLNEREGPPPTVAPTRVTWWVAPLFALWAALGAMWLQHRGRAQPRRAAVWLAAWAGPAAIFGLLIAVLELASSVPELRDNELVFSLLPTDVVLLGLAIRWWRRRALSVPWWLPGYALVRMGIVGLAVVARGLGVFIQQPWIVPVASLACSVALWWAVRGLQRTEASASSGTR